VPLSELYRLVEVMARLRQGCPWDAQQTHRSLVQYLIEETAETVEAIEADDRELLREELGDLLLQVIFHAEIAAEQPGGFGIEEVARGIADKLVARHPYVFQCRVVSARATASSGIGEGVSHWRRGGDGLRRSPCKARTVEIPLPQELRGCPSLPPFVSRARSRLLRVSTPPAISAS
jgi:XTP/dITP diphosphohydrolase